MFPWAAAAGAVGSVIMGNKQVQAAKEAANEIKQAAMRRASQLRELAAPFLEQVKTALPAFSNLIFGEYGSKLGQEDPYLKAAYEKNVQGIGRETERELGKSRLFGTSRGIGRSRGEELRIERSGLEAKGRATLGYGLGQRAYKERATERFSGGLQDLLNYGQTGIKLAAGAGEVEYEGTAGAAEMISGAKQDYYGDLGSLFGYPIGEYLGEWDVARMGLGGQGAVGGGQSVVGGGRTGAGGLPIIGGTTEEDDWWEKMRRDAEAKRLLQVKYAGR